MNLDFKLPRSTFSKLALPSLLMAACPALLVAAPKLSPQTVTYSCLGKKTVSVRYDLSAKDRPSKATVTLDGKSQQLPTFGKSNRYTLNFVKGDYSLSLDKTQLPLTKAPIMIFKKSKAKVSGKMMAVSKILYKNCSPTTKTGGKTNSSKTNTTKTNTSKVNNTKTN